MSRFLHAARAMILTGLTVLGMAVAVLGWWPLEGAAAGLAWVAGLSLAYLAGGLPAALRAGGALWSERVFDIDLLMVVAAPRQFSLRERCSSSCHCRSR